MSEWIKSSVLVVDDSALQREFAMALLHELGFTNVIQARDGLHAQEVLLARAGAPVDIVLSDLDMPGMDGIELMRVIAKQQWARNLIVMTARDPRLLDAVESMAQEDRTIRLLGVLRKPLIREQLMHVLERVNIESKEVDSKQDSVLFSVAEIEKALLASEFIPFYQPKVDIITGHLKGVEALARWQHPELGLIAPARFIPVLEQDGAHLMKQFTFALLEIVLRDLSIWLSRGLSLSVSVNLSAQSLNDAVIADQLARMVEVAHVPPRCLVLEVTETMVMDNLSSSIGNLARLRLKGFGLSMDDYGIGYSSMQQLSRCPFTELKIDRSFVDGASEHAHRRMILESAIDMGRRLNVTTVAEGVETEADWRLLKNLGCELGQGYFSGRPMPASELLVWFKESRQRLGGMFNE